MKSVSYLFNDVYFAKSFCLTTPNCTIYSYKVLTRGLEHFSSVVKEEKAQYHCQCMSVATSRSEPTAKTELVTSPLPAES